MKDLAVIILKLVLALALVPVVMSAVLSFSTELSTVPAFHKAFFAGVISYVVMNLFVVPGEAVFLFGQNLVLEIFRLKPRLGQFLARALPLYSLCSLGLLAGVTRGMNLTGTDSFFLWLTGFTFAMHIILIARTLFDLDTTLVKCQYILGLELILLAGLFLIMAILSTFYPQYSFVFFIKDMQVQIADHYARWGRLLLGI